MARFSNQSPRNIFRAELSTSLDMASSDAESVLVSRRRWLLRVALAAPVVGVGDAAVIEPRWLKVATFQRGRGEVRQRCVQITDIHFKGDRGNDHPLFDR